MRFRKLFYPLANVLLFLRSKTISSSYKEEDSILIFCSPRGGSTWLAELLTSIQGYNLIWEPLHLFNNPIAKKYGFTWHNYQNKHQENEVKENYLKGLFTGKELNTRTMTSLNLDFGSLINFKGLVIKFVNGNMILPWVANRFKCKKILMLRHPCAVVNSQLIFGGWKGLSKETMTIPSEFFQDYPQLKQVFDQLDHHEELLTFSWLCEAYVPMIEKEQNWLTIFYEDLVTNKESEIQRVFKYLERDIPKSAFERINKPSATTKKNSNVAQF